MSPGRQGLLAFPASRNNQRVERIVRKVFPTNCVPDSWLSPGDVGHDTQSIRRGRIFASRCVEHGDWPRRVEQLKVREDQHAYRA